VANTVDEVLKNLTNPAAIATLILGVLAGWATILLFRFIKWVAKTPLRTMKAALVDFLQFVGVYAVARESPQKTVAFVGFFAVMVTVNAVLLLLSLGLGMYFLQTYGQGLTDKVHALVSLGITLVALFFTFQMVRRAAYLFIFYKAEVKDVVDNKYSFLRNLKRKPAGGEQEGAKASQVTTIEQPPDNAPAPPATEP